ncbi:MAG: hypothetical protein KKC99_13145 [Proteobacteria bacterium]|nr:hypothetical protein [Pseudomonadota bacterium]
MPAAPREAQPPARGVLLLPDMIQIELAERLAACEAAFRRVQQAGCPVRYQAALHAGPPGC